MELEQNAVQPEAGETTIEKSEASMESVKTFTQDEVNEIVKNRLDRERKNLPSKEELNSFKEWKKSQQTEQEKFMELTKQFDEMKKENQILKVKNLVQKENINEMFSEFVIDKLLKQEGDFYENLKDFKTKNPQFFKTESTPLSTSPNLDGGKSAETKPKKFISYF